MQKWGKPNIPGRTCSNFFFFSNFTVDDIRDERQHIVIQFGSLSCSHGNVFFFYIYIYIYIFFFFFRSLSFFGESYSIILYLNWIITKTISCVSVDSMTSFYLGETRMDPILIVYINV